MNHKAELSFEDAVKLCKEIGGTMKMRDIFDTFVYHYDSDIQRFIDRAGNRFEMDGTEFDNVWIYEPPKKSAFQECIGQYSSCQFGAKTPNDFRKEGWNAMNDRIVNDPQIMLTPSEVEKIKALREP